jgi:hypothetical protein
MGVINIPRSEQRALAEIDTRELEKLIDQARRTEQIGELRRSLYSCGPYIAGELDSFEQALKRHREAKSARKREETDRDLRREAYDLSHAVATMKQRMEQEQKDGERFFVDDQIRPPFSFNKHLSVTVNYQWRRTVDDPWIYGAISFEHEVDLRPDYSRAVPSRKPSAAKEAQELKKRLSRTWEDLMRGALYSVRDYFQAGGDGSAIPKIFKTTVDAHSRGLNNYSTQFWR